MTAPTQTGVSDRGFATDVFCVMVISVGICLWSQEPGAMTLLVCATLGLRLWLFSRIPRKERDLSVAAELLFFGLCTLLGAANDWNSVTRHRIYDYTTPVYFPELSQVPIWMLLYWGLILRLVSSLFRWTRLRLPPLSNAVHLGRTPRHSSVLRIGLLLCLVLITRQTIYRLYLDPVLSWLPFLVGIGCWLLLVRPSARQLTVLAVFGSVGPAVEVLYIQVGRLHAYHLGVLWGVPVWIALWWILSAAIWGELSARIVAQLVRTNPNQSAVNCGRAEALGIREADGEENGKTDFPGRQPRRMASGGAACGAAGRSPAHK